MLAESSVGVFIQTKNCMPHALILLLGFSLHILMP